MTPAVTIGMPLYNNAGTLARAIASIKGQTFQDWRLIATDDGSDDESVAVAKRAANGDPRIELRENAHRLGHLNFGVSLKAARSDWFVWLGADDYWAPRFLEATLAAAGAHPNAVSVLPRWSYTGSGTGAPRTLPLDGPRTERVRRFLAAPGGTRMYGLTRRKVLQAAFPKRSFHAYDWYLVLGLIRQGPQIEVPKVLLYRERTPLRHYVESAVQENPTALAAWPVARMSLMALAKGHIPLRGLDALLKLNLRKHEEHLAYRHPARLARRLGLFKALGLPISSQPDRTREIAQDLLRNMPDQRRGAGMVLQRLMDRGDGAAAYLLGEARLKGVIEGDARTAFARGDALGNGDAAFALALLDRQAGSLSDTAFWLSVAKLATLSDRAARHLEDARRAGVLPPVVAAVERFRTAS
ncbi:MAG: glycosyltransferase family 2 protein [Pseudomonadota bacterium]